MRSCWKSEEFDTFDRAALWCIGILILGMALTALLSVRDGTYNFYAGCEWTGSRGTRSLKTDARIDTKATMSKWLGFYVETLDEQQALDGAK